MLLFHILQICVDNLDLVLYLLGKEIVRIGTDMYLNVAVELFFKEAM